LWLIRSGTVSDDGDNNDQYELNYTATLVPHGFEVVFRSSLFVVQLGEVLPKQ